MDMCDLENGMISLSLSKSEIDEIIRRNFNNISTPDGVSYVIPLDKDFSDEQLELVAEKNHPDQTSPDLSGFGPVYRVMLVPGGILIDSDMRTGTKVENKMYAGHPNLCPEDQTGPQKEAIETIADKVISMFVPYQSSQPSLVISQQL